MGLNGNQPLYQSGYAIGGKIVDIGNLCKERRPLNSDDIGFKDNQINIYINFDLVKSYGDKRDALLGVEQGTSQEKEYLKTGIHEAFGHVLYALQNIMQSYIQVSIGPLERPTTRGAGHEVGNEGGRLAEDLDKDVDEKMHELEQQQGYERIIK